MNKAMYCSFKATNWAGGRLALLLATTALAFGACAKSSEAPVADVIEPPVTGLRIGDTCEDTKECDYNLLCLNDSCTMVDDKPVLNPCIASGECQPGLYCSMAGVCAEAGEGEDGAPCTSGAECDKDSYCHALGMSGYCAPAGVGDVGDACSGTGDCLGGLRCGDSDTCEKSNLNFGLLPWPGVGPTVCSTETDAGPIRFHFEIPRENVNEFFRLPYPSDIRARNGRIELNGFPTPGKGLIGFDAVERLVDAIQGSKKPSFSLIPSVYFRFSGGIKFGSLNGNGESATIHFVNVDPDSPGYKSGQSYTWSVNDGGSKYLCPRFFAVHTAMTRPLDPSTTYAVLLTTGVQDKDGNLVEADTDLKLLLGSNRPNDTTEGAAWDAMAPLRSYLADSETKASADVVGAAVFTTHDVSTTFQQLRAAVQNIDQGAAKDVTVCNGANVSPCDDGLTGDAHERGCPATVDPAVHEVHMRVAVPLAQSGTRPYLEPADGGALKVNAAGFPTLSETEDVCVSLTIPKGVAMPPEGWPLMIYGHGTGGNYRSAAAQIGPMLSSVETDDGAGGTTQVGVAVAGWDAPMHGPRRGGSTIDPGVLFYNFANPVGARGNLFQGAVDVFALTKFLKGLTLPAADSPTGEEIRFNPALIAQTGHSQGATTGPLAAPYEPDIKLNVWSGAGAGLIVSLLNKTAPSDAKAGVAIALSEFNDQGIVDVSDGHPVLRLVQQYFDEVDPLAHARYAHRVVLEGQAPTSTLHIVGLGDAYTPNKTSQILSSVTGLSHINPTVIDWGNESVDAPLSGNHHGGSTTAALVVHAPDGYDGHYVLFRSVSAMTQYQQFVASWIANGVPTVVAP